MYFKFFIVFIFLKFISSVDIWPSSCPAVKKEKCTASKYYSADGSCNNLKISWWGKSLTPYARYQPAKYDDSKGTPRTKASGGGKLPNSRKVSLQVNYPQTTIEDKLIKISHYATMYGQFFSFDMTHILPGDVACTCNSKNPECFNMPTPPGDTIDKNQKCQVFTRSKTSYPTFNCKPAVREQLNQATHWMDLSQLYGPDKKTNDQLRDKNGLLKTKRLPGFKTQFLQFSPLGSCRNDKPNRQCFRSGDGRVNENMVLTSIFTLFAREHNNLAGKLKKLNPKWNGEKLYQETRRLLIAIYQKIGYEDYLPLILGSKTIKDSGLQPSKGYFMKYDPKLNPQIRNEFATSAGRWGHTLVNEWGLKASPSLQVIGNISFISLLGQPGEAYTNGGLDGLCSGALIDRSRGFDASFTNPIQNHMFEDPSPKAPTHQQSLSALNTNRGRDHGTPAYIVYRKFCKLSVPKSFDDLNKDILPETVKDLKKTYKSVNDMDLFTGLISEKPIKGATVGPTAACIISKTYVTAKNADRLFYENGKDSKTRFSLNQIKEIRKMTMSRILCDNLHLTKIQKNAFLLPDTKTNPFVNCDKIPQMNLKLWKS